MGYHVEMTPSNADTQSAGLMHPVLYPFRRLHQYTMIPCDQDQQALPQTHHRKIEFVISGFSFVLSSDPM